MASIHERFEINVPAERVYQALSQPERIVGALPGVTSIYRYAQEHYRVDIGSAGRNSELDLQVTERVPPRRLAWHSRDGRWTGSAVVESLGAARSLVVIEVIDSHGTVGDAQAAEDAAVVDAALRALKQALETAAVETAEPAAAGDDIRVSQRLHGEREERGATDEPGGREGEPRGGEDRWRGSRGFFPGGDQAMGMLRSLSREMDKLWDQVMRRAATAGRGQTGFMAGWTPAVEVCERDDDVRVCAEVPGVEPGDLHVEVDAQLLVIRGERRADTPEGAPPRSERVYGSFVRRIPLPAGVQPEQARARLRNGVLEVCIPFMRLRRGREVPIENADAERSS